MEVRGLPRKRYREVGRQGQGAVSGGMIAIADHWLALLLLSVSGAVLSAIFMVQSVHRGAAWAARIWGVFFAAASFMAAYCFGQLLGEA